MLEKKNIGFEISQPLVSICCTTYQHADYIGEAIESFLMQEVDFTYEIIIRDDASTDGTSRIVQDYAEKYPWLIRAIINQENLFKKGVRPMADCMSFAKGEYIALCEGDDYWIDQFKLQKQVDLLRDHPGASMCFSFSKSIIESKIESGLRFGRSFGPPSHFIKTKYYRNDFLASNLAPTSTIIFKREAIDSLPDWYGNWHLGDWTLSLHLLTIGYGVFLNECTSYYRVHDKGVWSKIPAKIKFERQISLILFLLEIEENKRSKKILYLNLFSQELGLLLIFIKQKKINMFFPMLIRLFHSAMRAEWSVKNLKLYFQKIIVFKNYLRLYEK